MDSSSSDNNNNSIVFGTTRYNNNMVAITATSNTAFFEFMVPEEGRGGFLLDDVALMARELRVRPIWLADQLSRLDGGVAGPRVAELALLYGNNMEQVADVTERITRLNSIRASLLEVVNRRGLNADGRYTGILDAPVLPPMIVNSRRPRLNTFYGPIPQDHTCVICLMNVDEAGGGQQWVTAEGCNLHFFHRSCMAQFRGGLCMLCRAPLVAE